MARDKLGWQDALTASFGQDDEGIQANKDGLVIGGHYGSVAGTLDHGDFGVAQLNASGHLMVDIGTGEVIASMGTINVLESGSIIVTAGTIGDLDTVGTVGVLNSGSVVVTAGTIGDLDTVGTVGVLSAGSVVVTAGTIGDLDTVGTVGVLTSGSVVMTAGTVSTLNTVGTVGVLNSGSVVVTAGTADVDMVTLISGEDQTNNVMKTEQQFSYYHHVGTAGVVIGTAKASAGLLHTVTVNTVGTSPLTIYDSVGTSATVIGIMSGTIEQTKLYNVKCPTGITVGGTSVIDVTVSYR